MLHLIINNKIHTNNTCWGRFIRHTRMNVYWHLAFTTYCILKFLQQMHYCLCVNKSKWHKCIEQLYEVITTRSLLYKLNSIYVYTYIFFLLEKTFTDIFLLTDEQSHIRNIKSMTHWLLTLRRPLSLSIFLLCYFKLNVCLIRIEDVYFYIVLIEGCLFKCHWKFM